MLFTLPVHCQKETCIRFRHAWVGRVHRMQRACSHCTGVPESHTRAQRAWEPPWLRASGEAPGGPEPVWPAAGTPLDPCPAAGACGLSLPGASRAAAAAGTGHPGTQRPIKWRSFAGQANAEYSNTTRQRCSPHSALPGRHQEKPSDCLRSDESNCFDDTNQGPAGQRRGETKRWEAPATAAP